MAKSLEDVMKEEEGQGIPPEILNGAPDEIERRCKLMDNEIKILRNENGRLQHEQAVLKERIAENIEKN